VSGRVLVAAVALAAMTVGACDDGGIVVRGIVIEVQQSSPVRVDGFTLRTDAGELLHFVVGDLPAGGGSFPAIHLRDHLAGAAPIDVRYVVDHDRLLVLRLADAP